MKYYERNFDIATCSPEDYDIPSANTTSARIANFSQTQANALTVIIHSAGHVTSSGNKPMDLKQ